MHSFRLNETCWIPKETGGGVIIHLHDGITNKIIELVVYLMKYCELRLAVVSANEYNISVDKISSKIIYIYRVHQKTSLF